MKLLIIGDASSQFVKNFSITLKHFDDSIEIDIITVNPVFTKEIVQENKKYYQKIYNYEPVTGLKGKIPKLRGIILKSHINSLINNINKDIDKYDVVLLHGFWKTNCYIFSKLSTKDIFKVGAIWGSDFYKRVENGSVIFEAMDRCDLVTISTKEMMKDILKAKQIEKDKIRNCLFGLTPLDYLFRLQNVSAKESKNLLGFKGDDFIITCGYSGSPNNQHLRIISMLMDIKAQLPEQTKLVLPVTYGGSNGYKLNVKKALRGSGFDNFVYEKFLTDEEMAFLRKATDIMLQIPIIDAFSGSFQEHLFAQNIVIAGSWLPYQSLKNKGIYYETIDSIGELNSKLLFVLNNFTDLKNKVVQLNTPDKFRSSLWSECIKGWHSALKEYKS